MGIDVFVMDFLLDYKGTDLGDALCLGRQAFHVAQDPAAWERAKAVFAYRVPEIGDPNIVIQDDGYSESFFRFLGAKSVLSLDQSSYESAEIVHDLNKPISSQWHSRFDFIFDGGTLEHVYNLPSAIYNIKSLLRVGGLFVSVNAANNQLGHGLYQFGPELFWRAFDETTGFVVEKTALVQMHTAEIVPPRIMLVDQRGARQEIGQTAGPAYLMVAIRRQQQQIGVGDAYQGDYAEQWRSFDERSRVGRQDRP